MASGKRKEPGIARSVLRKPDWLKVRICRGPNYARLRNIILQERLHTVCEEALCPNIGRCWENGRVTLMILGDTCTRSCKFCGIASGWPGSCDEDEPRRVGEAVKTMGLKNVVITSVSRDDLEDCGAHVWAETIRRVHEAVPGISVEVLVPDFGGSAEALGIVIHAKPEILGHNIETVPFLYERVRPQADYQRSLKLLKQSHEQGMITKTGIMLGLGEKAEDVLGVMRDTVAAGCDIFYIGQYLQPSRRHLPVSRYVEPGEFEMYRKKGLEMGFKVVVAGALVRSSYHSEEQAEYVKTQGIRHEGAIACAQATE